MIRVAFQALIFGGFLLPCACSSDSVSNGPSGAGAPISAGSTAVAGSAGLSAGGASAGSGAAGVAGAAGSVAAAGASAGSGGSGGSSAGASSALLTDDFEAATIASKWTPRSNGGSMFDLDQAQKHGGTQSLHVKHNGFSSMLAVEGAPLFPAPNNTFYGRLWLRAAGPLPQGHVVWFEAGDVMNDAHEVRVGMNIGKFQSNLWYQGEVDIRDPDAKVTADEWHCVSFQFGPDVLDVSLDGVHSSISTKNWVAADQANGNTQAKAAWTPTYAAFRLGWELGSGEIWYDDIALGHSPLPCP